MIIRLIKWFFKKPRCKYYKICKDYTKDSITCNVNGGMYYASGTRPAGCYARLEEDIFGF